MLPNSPNVILAAERAAELSEKPARVVPTTAPQEGLAALLAFDPARAPRPTRRPSARRPRRCASAAWPRPPATTPRAASRAGDAVGYEGGELVAWGDPAETLAATLARIADGAELLTCIAGEGAPLDRDEVEARVPGRRGGRVPRGRPARVVVAALRGVDDPRPGHPRRFASTRAAPRRRSGRARIRSPSLLAEPIEGREGAGAARHRHLGRPDRASAARPPRPPRASGSPASSRWGRRPPSAWPCAA